MPGRHDGCFNALPDLQVVFDYEGDGSGIPDPANVQHAYELIGTLEQPQARIHSTYVWITEVAEETPWVAEHVHDYDEVLIWTGSDPSDPRDLGATLRMVVDGEEHIVTRSGSVYIPAGTPHCPLDFIEVRRPFTFSALSLAPEYAARR
ncbi:MAG: hypothetical protein J7484_13485 [Microbacterium sp.]|nr:hypothetical protein [Microbacterium sp.]